jgi:diguanylate cyclase (GGDEF)-like protein
VFEDRLDHALERARREGTHVGVLFLDIDRFKVVNDSLGHSVGDALLHKAADRLRGCVREADTVARMGGDEFAVLLEAVESEAEAEEAAERVAGAFQEPFRVGGTEIPSDVSIGLALSHHEEVEEAEDLLRFSDIAMYRMKETKGTGYRTFDPTSDHGEAVRFQRERHLKEALEKEAFEVWYQPVVDLREKRVVGVEALVRWRHPEKGLLPARDFVPFAEESGLLEELDRRVFEEACGTASAWPQTTDGRGLWLSVNLSAECYRARGLIEYIRSVLKEAGLSPGRLLLEITESLLASGTGRLQDLRTEDVRIAIDDFGTGQSSFHSLRRIPADALKIDQSFVAGLDGDPRSRAIVEAMTMLARRMDMEVIAEGIETASQLEHLERFGCGLGQGGFFGHPMPPEEFEELLPEGRLP